MGLFNIFKKKVEEKQYNITDEQKNEVENICTEYLKIIAKEYDKKLEDGGSFNSKENCYIWDNHGFIINFLAISQDDYFEQGKVFEMIGKELKERIKTVIDIEAPGYEDDCPIIFYKVIANKNLKNENNQVISFGNGCVVSKKIFEENYKIGYMKRDFPSGEYPDSGWRFFVGDEDETYTIDSNNMQIYSLESVIEHDSDIEKYLNTPNESEFIRINEHDFIKDDGNQKIYIIKKENIKEEATINKIVKEIEETLKIKLPQDYIEYMGKHNGYNGMVNEEYYNIWKLEDIVSMNNNYQVQEFFPNLIYFGSNGGGEALAFDKFNNMCIVSIPFIGTEEDKMVIANNFDDFINK